jgi:hypothetical protein
MNPIHPLLRADRELGVKKVLTHDSAKPRRMWYNTGNRVSTAVKFG